MVVEYLSYVKSIATFALTFYGYIILVLASLNCSKEKRMQEVPTLINKAECCFFCQASHFSMHA